MALAANQIINKILQNKDFSIVKTNALTKELFGGYEKEFEFIVDHYNKYGNVPDLPTFLDKFDGFELFQVAESDEYLLSKLNEQSCYVDITEILPIAANKAKEDAIDAYHYLKDSLDRIKPREVLKGIDIIDHADERYQKYIEKCENKDVATIKTGLPELDDIFGGWEYGDELVSIVARTNQGKSWILMKFLAEAWIQGKRVGLYSGEMNHIKLGFRFDALFKHFSNRALVQGFQTDGYKEYIDSLPSMNTDNRCFLIGTQKEFHGRPTVEKIRAFIEENNIEIMGIDQYSLMEDGRSTFRDPTRLKLAHIAEDLFSLSSEYRIPILGLCQANREGINKDDQTQAPGLENIKESDDISHNSSKCIGMRQSNFGLVLDIIKNREGRVGDKLLYSWDIDTGSFSYIPSSDDAARPDIRQNTAQQNRAIFQPSASVNPF